MFFQPRIGLHYEEGFKGCKTLVLGVKHHCTLRNCKFYDDCVMHRNCASYDSICPAYGERRDLKLSLSNYIEIDAFLEEYDHYPTYTYFTKLMLEKADDLNEEEKIGFWEHVAFANYLQYFCPSPQVPEFKDDSNDYRQEDFVAFLEILNDLQPEVVFVWNPSLKSLLNKNIADGKIEGLRHFDDFRSETLTVNRYIYKVQTKANPEDVFNAFAKTYCADFEPVDAVRMMLNALQKARFRYFVPKKELKLSSAMLNFVNKYIWDENLERYLINLMSEQMGLNYIVSCYKSDICKLVESYNVASSFPIDFLKTNAINVGAELEELSWFDFGKTSPTDDSDVAILYLKDTNDVFKNILKSLNNNSLRKIILLVKSADSDKFISDVASCEGLRYITEKDGNLMIEISSKSCEKVSLKHSGATLYPRHGSLKRASSLCPSDFVSSTMSKSELDALIYSVFHRKKKEIATAKGTKDLADLFERMLENGWLCKRGKHLSAVRGKSGQLLYYGLHQAGLSWTEIETLFADENISKNSNKSKIMKLLPLDKTPFNYYKNLFGL